MVDSTQRYKAYPEYKDSGVEWLGEIPSHWNVKRLGQFFKERRQKVSDKDYPPLSVTMKGIVPQLENAAKTDAGDNRKLVLKNDFVINSRSDRKGSSGVSKLDGSVSLISIVLEPKGISPRYAHHLLRSYNFQEEFYRHGKGIVADLWSTNSSEMKDILIPEISENESNAIASFLDYETARIDTLIEKQQRLIELLTEKRQAVISHTVIKGLNPDVPMKDSGVEWLGEIPAHWEYATVRRYLIEHRQGYYTKDSYVNDGVKLLRITDLRDLGKISIENCPQVPEHKSLKNYLLEEGDVVFARTGGAGSFGVVPRLQEKLAYASYLIRFKFLPEYFDTNYLRYMLIADSFQLAVKQNIHGGVNQNIHAEDIKNTFVASPPIAEQQQISAYLDEHIEKYNQLINKASYQIKLMQERRTALISATVTGKIDVRDWVKPD